MARKGLVKKASGSKPKHHETETEDMPEKAKTRRVKEHTVKKKVGKPATKHVVKKVKHVEAPVKKRGRPKKVHHPVEMAKTGKVKHVESPVKKKAGRPKKHHVEEAPKKKSGLTTKKRGRGRPSGYSPSKESRANTSAAMRASWARRKGHKASKVKEMPKHEMKRPHKSTGMKKRGRPKKR